MTSQPVKYTFTDDDGDRLLIRSGARVTRAFLHTSNIDGFFVAPADAPDVALALLECAGLSIPSRVLRGLEALGRDERQKVEDAKRAEEEAARAKAEEEAKAKAADEALDALALRLLNAHREAAGLRKLASLEGATGISSYAWRAVARAAQAAPEPPRFSLVSASADGWSTAAQVLSSGRA